MHAQLQSQRETAPPVPSVRTALLRRAAVNASPANAVPSLVHEVLRSPGQPLNAATRAFMEPRFGHDFSGVRVHTDAKAVEAARAVNARAYTVGENVVFGAGQFMPTDHTRQRLLAHELTHVIQQSNNQTALQHSSLAISKPDDASEREADQIADVVMGSRAPASLQADIGKSGGSVMLQRTIGDGHDLQSARFAGDSVLEACFDNERLLQFGSRGPAVEKLQQALIDAGFPLPVFGVDGIFESETRTAVRDFQRARGVSRDGIVGQSPWELWTPSLLVGHRHPHRLDRRPHRLDRRQPRLGQRPHRLGQRPRRLGQHPRRPKRSPAKLSLHRRGHGHEPRLVWPSKLIRRMRQVARLGPLVSGRRRSPLPTGTKSSLLHQTRLQPRRRGLL